MKKLICVFVLLTGWNVFGQVIPNKDKVKLLFTGGSPVTGLASKIERLTGNIISCGFMNTVSNGKDAALVKLDSNLNQIWFVQFDSLGLDDKFNDTYINPTNGDIYVTGFVKVASGNKNVVAAKYNSSGILQWRVYGAGNANLDDEGNSIAFDGTNVWITGYVSVTGKGKDLFVWKISGSTGTSLAQPRRNGTANGDDIGYKICISGTSAFVTGYTSNTSTNKDIYIACFNLSTAALTWSTSTNGSASGDDSGLDILYNLGDLYVCGYRNQSTTGDDYYFARINVSNGSIKYSDTYDAGWNGSDQATSMVSTKTGFYGVTGLATDGSSNNYYNTRMYDTSNVYWTHSQPINGSYTLMNPKISVDTIAWHFYCAGTYSNSTLDGLLYQLDPTGVKRWTQYHNGVNNAGDGFIDLIVDGLARIFVASPNETGTGTGIYDYKLIRYSQTPVYMPVNYNMASDTFSFGHLFYPNTSEVKDTSGSWASDALFYTQFAKPQEYILKNKIAFCNVRHDTTQTNPKDTLERIDMIFDNANEFSEVFGSYYQEDAKLNYFMNYTGTGLTNVKGASHLICPNIYPMIDLHYSSNKAGAKYYFVVKPTGDPNNIRIRFDGAVSTSTVSNRLVITSEMDSWAFNQPDCYYVSVPSFTNLSITTTSVTGGSRWVSLGSDTYSIDPGSYNIAWPLVIEFDRGRLAAAASPTNNLTWSTYYGWTNFDEITAVKSDVSKNLYVAGYTSSNALPFATGPSVFQSANKGQEDGFIAKFDSLGVLKWLTYVGGTKTDVINGFDIANNGAGDLYCVGYTFSSGSTTGLPIKPKFGAPGAMYYSSHDAGNNADAFIFEIAQNGNTNNWLTYYPGNGAEDLRNCMFDGNGNLFLIGASTSSNLPVVGSSPSYTANYSDPNNYPDAYIMKLSNTTFTINWATYIGSSAPSGSNTADRYYDLDINSNNEVYAVGGSFGNNYPVDDGSGNSPDTYSLSTQGAADGIITRFDNSGQILWSSYFGSDLHDEFATVKCYESSGGGTGNRVASPGGVYIGGFTNETSTFRKKKSGQYYYNYGSDTHTEGTFVNYDNSNLLVHSSTIGGSDDDENISDIVMDKSNNIYLLGTSASNNVPTPIGGNSASAWYSNNNGGSDYLIFTVAPGDTDIVWSTQVGGIINEGGSVRGAIDAKNRLFLTGTAMSPFSFPWNDGGGNPVHYQDSLCGTVGDKDGSITRFDLQPVNFAGINEQKITLNESVFIYPNPSSSLIHVKISNFNKKQTFNIYNNLGQVVLKGNLDQGINTLNISSLASGMYVFEVISKDSKGTAKFIKYD